jgi:hypothetical protein
MNEQQLAAVKQALEALEIVRPMENPEPAVEEAIAALQSIISQDALYKMAEDAVTIGLSYNDWPKIGCVNHDCDQCKAVQEPVAKVYRHGESSNGTPWHGIKWLDEGVNMPDGTLLYATPQPVPVKTYSDGKPWPVAPKPWVGLTHEEMEKLSVENGKATFLNDDEETDILWFDGDCFALLKAAEAKLKEKNHDQ